MVDSLCNTSAKQERHFCVCVCVHVCFRTYNISVVEGWRCWQGQGVGSECQDLSVLSVFEVRVQLYVCMCVIMCTDVLYVQVCVVVAGVSMPDPARRVAFTNTSQRLQVQSSWGEKCPARYTMLEFWFRMYHEHFYSVYHSQNTSPWADCHVRRQRGVVVPWQVRRLPSKKTLLKMPFQHFQVRKPLDAFLDTLQPC